jgi:hypothetical protein
VAPTRQEAAADGCPGLQTDFAPAPLAAARAMLRSPNAPNRPIKGPRSLRVLKLVRRIAIPLAALACALLCLATAADGAMPSGNIPLGSMPSSCATEASTECQRWVIERLDAARADLGLSAYALPVGFAELSADRQLLILTDLDRVAYGYTPVYGLDADLAEAAQAGVREGRDPTLPAAGGPWKGWGSVWASTGALTGYYLWMYDDGYGGPNADCPSPGATGCWGHRKVILGELGSSPQPQLMGAAVGSAARSGGTALIISSNGGTGAYYTWAQAQQEGAGASGEEPPPVSPESPAGEEPKTPATPPGGGPTASTQSATPPPSGSGKAPGSEALPTGVGATAKIAVLLGDHLLLSGRAARIPAVLQRGGITLTLPRGLRGTLDVDYYLRSTRRLLVARATRLLSGGTEAVAVKLTAAGRYVLRHQGSVSLAVYARLVPAGVRAIHVSKPLVLNR